MAIGGRLLENRPAQVEVADDRTGAQVKVVLDDLGDLGISLARERRTRAVGVDEDREGVRDADGVGKLHKHAVAQAGGHEGLGHPAGSVGGRAVDLGGVFAGKGSATVCAPAAVGVDDNFAASEACIAVGAANNEAPRGVKVVDGALVEVLGGHDWLDDVLEQLLLDVFLGDVLAVLGGDDNCVHADGDGLAVLHAVLASHLGLAVGAHPGAGAVLADLGEPGTERGGQVVRKGHHRGGLVGGVAEHDALIAGTDVLELVGINGLGNIGGLLLNGHNNVARAVVEALGDVVVANLLERLADHLLIVDGGSSGDLTENHHHASLGASLAGHTGGGVLAYAGIEDSVRDLIADLVGVTLVDGLGREKEGVGL